MQQLLPDVSPLVQILQRAGQERRDEITRQDAVNHAMFMDVADPNEFNILAGKQFEQGFIDEDELMEYQQLAQMMPEQRNKTIARDLISGGFQDLVFDKEITGQQQGGLPSSVRETMWFNQQPEAIQKDNI